MKLVRITSDTQDKRLLDDFATLMIKYHKWKSPQIPVPKAEFFLKELEYMKYTHLSKIHHLLYLDELPDTAIAIITIYIHHFKDKDRVGIEFFDIRQTDDAIPDVELPDDPLADPILRALSKISELFPEEADKVEIWSHQLQKEEIDRLFGTINPEITYSEIQTVLKLDRSNKEEIIAEAKKLKRIADSNGFDLLRFENHNFDDIEVFSTDELYQVVTSIWNDMPVEDTNWDKEDSEDISRYFDDISKALDKLGHTDLFIIAYHREDQKIAGYTNIRLGSDFPDLVFQGDTGVIQAYRGNNMGYILKMQSYKILLEEYPDVEYWLTWNAGSNDHMRRINHRMGYKDQMGFSNYVTPKQKFLDYINQSQT